MRSRPASTMLIGAVLLSIASLAAQAKPPHDRDHGRDRGEHHGEAREHHAPPPPPRHYAGMHDRGRHEGWYKKGGYLPRDYRDDRYAVADWRRDHLRQPPRGYRWVRSDNGDFLLVAIASGLIADLLLHR